MGCYGGSGFSYLPALLYFRNDSSIVDVGGTADFLVNTATVKSDDAADCRLDKTPSCDLLALLLCPWAGTALDCDDCPLGCAPRQQCYYTVLDCCVGSPVPNWRKALNCALARVLAPLSLAYYLNDKIIINFHQASHH